MRVKIREHDGKLEMVVTAESYEEHILVRAFLREQGGVALPISTNPNGQWSLTLGSCKCEQYMREAELRLENCSDCGRFREHGHDCGASP